MSLFLSFAGDYRRIYAPYINSITYLTSPTASISTKQTNSLLQLRLGSPTSLPTSPDLLQMFWHHLLRPIRRPHLNLIPRLSSFPSSTETSLRTSFTGVQSYTTFCARIKVRKRTRARTRTAQKPTSPCRHPSHPRRRRTRPPSPATWRMSTANQSPNPRETLLVLGPGYSGMASTPPCEWTEGRAQGAGQVCPSHGEEPPMAPLLREPLEGRQDLGQPLPQLVQDRH